MTYIVMTYIVMACIVMTYIVMACIVMAYYGYGLYSSGPYSPYVLYTHDQYRYGLYRYGLYRYGLYSYCLYSYGLYLVVKTGGRLSSCVKPPTEAAQLLDRVVGSLSIGVFGWHTRSRSVTMPLRFGRPEPRRQTDRLDPHDGLENSLWCGVFAS